jgi:hypothetical protein
MDVMEKPTREQIHTSIKGESRCCVGPVPPEIMRQHMLNLGATPEQAEQAARFWEEENRKNGYVLDKAS